MTTPPSPKRIAHILQRARDHISDPKGWIKGSFSIQGAQGAIDGLPCCMWGAILWAVGSVHSNRDLDTPYSLAVRNHLGMELADFNDNPSTTHAQVLTTLDEVIALQDQMEPIQ